MSPRLPSIVALALLMGVANAGYWEYGNPPGLHPREDRQALSLRGQVSGLKLSGRHGRTATVTLARPYSLDEALPLPAGHWDELTLVLEGPVTVALGSGPPHLLNARTLTVVLEDPDAASVVLDWSLPEGAWSALKAGVEVTGLPALLEDGALALPAR